jgi:predicted amidohydrolase YtcJ
MEFLMNRFCLIVAAALPMVHSPTVCADDKPADLVLRGGKIVTLDERNAVVEAVAARAGRVVALGSQAQINKLIGANTRVIDVPGKLVIPGFIEGHGHFTSLGHSRMELDLRKAKSWDDIIQLVETAAKKAQPGDWIIGHGWHQEKWTTRPDPNVEGYPVHTRLSAVTPKNPVLLSHASGHMCFANAEAMHLANVTAQTKNPPGGEILRDQTGNPTGIFRETAQGWVNAAHRRALVNRPAEEKARVLDEAIRLAEEECLAKGITSFQDAGSDFGTIDVFKRMAENGKLKIRLWVMARSSISDLSAKLARCRVIGLGDNHLTVRGIKQAIDGALGPHGAWLLEPYEDLSTSSGLNTTSLETIRQSARLALKHDYQLCVHAIGDRANRETLDAFEEAFKEQPGPQSRRWRIEHAQHLHPDDIPRFAKLGVIASMQGIHCTSDAVFVVQRLGLRRASQGAYVWRSLMNTGALISNGTDTPVEDVDPIPCYYATVTRKLSSGATFFPEQRMNREEALRSYTINAAYAAFEEDIKGALAPGKLADVVVLSEDILTVPDEKILEAQVLYTIVGGKVVYQRK